MSLDDAPDLGRFSRDPALRDPAHQPVQAQIATAPRRDPYRDRNVLGGLALVVAVLSIPATIVSALVPVPTLVGFAITGIPISLALLGLVASYKLQFPTRMAWLAVAISIATMAAGWAIDAQQLSSIPIPGVGL